MKKMIVIINTAAEKRQIKATANVSNLGSSIIRGLFMRKMMVIAGAVAILASNFTPCTGMQSSTTRRLLPMLGLLGAGYTVGRAHGLYNNVTRPAVSVKNGIAGIAAHGEYMLAQAFVESGAFSEEEAWSAAKILMDDFQSGAINDINRRVADSVITANMLTEHRTTMAAVRNEDQR